MIWHFPLCENVLFLQHNGPFSGKKLLKHLSSTNQYFSGTNVTGRRGRLPKLILSNKVSPNLPRHRTHTRAHNSTPTTNRNDYRFWVLGFFFADMMTPAQRGLKAYKHSDNITEGIAHTNGGILSKFLTRLSRICRKVPLLSTIQPERWNKVDTASAK